jgi:membrane-bound metal-dependent hydrolase YbcI (DUF457 family)
MLVALYFHPLYGLAVAAGYASHLFCDMITHSGLALFWPVWGRSFHILPPGARLRTGGRVELVLYAALFALLFWQLVQQALLV